MVRRRRFSAEFKARVVLELISGAKSQARLCKVLELNPTTWFRAGKPSFWSEPPSCSGPTSTTTHSKPEWPSLNGWWAG